MNLYARELADTLVVEVGADRIDAACAIQFKDAMRELAGRAGTRVLIDMSRVRFLDSSGLGAVVAVMKLLGPDRRLELAGLTPAVDKVFRLTRMDSVFLIHPDLPAGLREAG
ncbi:STAS domain-containing protein [Gemmobacter sp. LW-1]|jgi:anti-sigma B factor antagonist|uniref:STAS domain-containing protein n=1 Tax=Gemmobacter sp. LW-1 TaxID=1529005 RepID=UPI0006C755CC|nr:STAS domain-containing protein [Gemmobacter sp. LW-1]